MVMAGSGFASAWFALEPRHWLYLSLPILALVCLSLVCKSLRYGLSRRLVLNLFCWIQGRRAMWVEDPTLAHRILQSSCSKGNCIEQLLSVRAFHPVLSLESVDGDQWMRMKKAFLVLRTHLPPLQLLHSITKDTVNRCLDSELVIDCPVLVRLIFDIMLKWLFDRNLEPGDLPLISAAVEECRKALAIKGAADPDILAQLIDWMKKTVRGSKYFPVFGDKWEEPEYWSLFLQPFFISPAINLTDLAVTLDSEAFKSGLGLDVSPHRPVVIDHHLIVDAINASHPFPVLERWFPEGLKAEYSSQSDNHGFLIQPNTHVFLPMDEIGRQLSNPSLRCDDFDRNGNKNESQHQWAAFGAGKRSCAGQDIAFVLTSQLLSGLLSQDACHSHTTSGKKPQPRFRPSVGHTYSGRDNDLRETWTQNYFQIKILISTTSTLVKQRLTSMLCASRNKVKVEDSDCDYLDRLWKYGLGTLRLFLLLGLYLHSLNFPRPSLVTVFNYAMFGIGGACLNLHVLSRPLRLLVLAILALCFLHQQCLDPTSSVLLLYFSKTVLGDYLAGKLDHRDWLLAFLIYLLLWAVLSQFLAYLPGWTEVQARIWSHVHPFLVHTTAHFLCEVGDGKCEANMFWRHRYSYEVTSLAIFTLESLLWPSSTVSRELVLVDGIASLFYRLTNLLAIIVRK